MSKQNQIVNGAGHERLLNETHNDSVTELVELGPEMLADVGGGPNGSVTPDGGHTVPPVNN
jgi:hypothetical protein